MEARRAAAATLHERTIQAFSESWEDAITEIALGDRYDGLEIEPQIGLIPLGADPLSGLYEFGHLESGQIPARDEATGRLDLDGSSAIVLVLLPGGRFRMGAQSTDPHGPGYDPDARPDEQPPRHVELEPFFLSKYEMTQGQWMRLTGESPSEIGVGHPAAEPDPLRHPVETVDWFAARRVMKRAGLVLPSEARWEYAARGGADTVWWTGSAKESLRGMVNLANPGAERLRVMTTEKWEDGYLFHAPVGRFPGNAFGLHEVSGNVSEWCADWFGGPDLDAARQGDEGRLLSVLAEESGKPADVAVRGGGFFHVADVLRLANRGRVPPTMVDFAVGLRPARDL